ncbi:hypothetical protein QUH73_20300 [Labilibaculum sp. K2S]|uniref:hypothetical protein n=1 Tax=Labilibaculum sp. K2S TaxID=3056386 RepID=UPI0025A489B5|nr:hypothetical protein [Labilibaculum sp. K2S]MDM8162171.1 hypothetical protein [Labilibaculum sp. K2S]
MSKLRFPLKLPIRGAGGVKRVTGPTYPARASAPGLGPDTATGVTPTVMYLFQS